MTCTLCGSENHKRANCPWVLAQAMKNASPTNIGNMIDDHMKEEEWEEYSSSLQIDSEIRSRITT